MSQNRGRIWSAVFLLITSLAYGAEPYTWSLKTNKSSVYVNEAVEVEYTCSFEDKAYLYVIEFNPEGENDAYRMLPIGEVESIKDAKRSNTYRYVLFPKKAGFQIFDFTALMRKTTKASIENSVIGRDNVESYVFKDTVARLPQLQLTVQGHREKMTGRFNLNVTLDKREVKAYEPVHLDVQVEGEGDFDQMQDFNVSIEGVTVFSEPGEKHYALSKEGFKGKWEQKFSLVGNKSFTIRPLELSYFDIAKKERVVLRSEPFEVAVKAGYKPEELLDEPEAAKGRDWWSWSYLYYLLTFAAGALTGRFLSQLSRAGSALQGFEAEVEQCTSVKNLLTALVMSGDPRYATVIGKYEKLGDKGSLRELKKEIRTLLKNQSHHDTITKF